MAKKNFDDFIATAGKRKKPSPEEVEELAQIIHQPPPAPKPEPKPEPKPVQKPVFREPVAKTAAPQPAAHKEAKPPARRIVGKEKIRVTVDINKDLYRKLKMQVVLDETDISSYIRELLEKSLAKAGRNV
jgi:hypothetical protein